MWKQWASARMFVLREVRYRYNETNYPDVAGQDTQEKGVSFQVGTRTNAQLLDWQISGSYRDQQSDDGFRWEQTRSELNLGYNLTPRFTLIALGGTEKNEYEQSNTEDDGTFWSAGFTWRLSQRSQLTLRGGRRISGRSAFLDFSQSNRYWRWTANYEEELFTNAGVLNSRQEAGGPLTLPEDATLTTEVFLRKNAEVTGTRSYGRTNITLRVFKQTRDYQITGDSDETQGGSILWSWAFHPRTRLELDLSSQREELRATTRIDNLYTGRVGILRQVSAHGLVTLSYRYSERDSNEDANDYDQGLTSLSYVYTY